MGHSTLPIEEFIGRLKVHEVCHVVDVRTIPRSRHNPQFNSDALAASLKESGLKYTHMPQLGGLRRTSKQSPNVGWRNLSFRGYADYMQSGEFAQAVEALIALSQEEQVVMVCAEAVPWRCHRSLIADALLVRRIPVEHISSGRSRRAHTLTPFAKVRGKKLTYPAEGERKEAPGARGGAQTNVSRLRKVPGRKATVPN